MSENTRTSSNRISRRMRPLPGGEDISERSLGKFVTFLLALLLAWIVSWLIDWQWHPAVYGFAGVLFALHLLAVLRAQMAKSKIGMFEVRAHPRPIRIGGPLFIEVVFTTRAAVPLQAVGIRLYAKESAGEGRQSTEQITFDETRRALEGIQTFPHIEYKATAEFELPREARNSFVRGDASCEWLLDVSLQIPGWPDYRIQYPLKIRPPVGERGEVSERE